MHRIKILNILMYNQEIMNVRNIVRKPVTITYNLLLLQNNLLTIASKDT